MSNVALRDKCSTAARRAHRRHKLNIYELHIAIFFAVVPARVVHPLP